MGIDIRFPGTFHTVKNVAKTLFKRNRHSITSSKACINFSYIIRDGLSAVNRFLYFTGENMVIPLKRKRKTEGRIGIYDKMLLFYNAAVDNGEKP